MVYKLNRTLSYRRRKSMYQIRGGVLTIGHGAMHLFHKHLCATASVHRA